MIQADFSLEIKGFHLKGEMNDGGLILLSGENGSGKSTFLKSLSGLIPMNSGIVRVNDVDVSQLSSQDRRIVYATQNSYFSHMDVRRHILWAMIDKPDESYFLELLDAFGINFKGRLRELSMGQRMRVTLATAFANRPRAILLDEVISNISEPESILAEVKRMAGKTSTDVVFVAHSLGGKTAEHHYSMESGIMKREF